MDIKDLKIDKGDDTIHLAHLSDTGQCYIGTNSYGEATSMCLNKTEIKRIIKWLSKWLKKKE